MKHIWKKTAAFAAAAIMTAALAIPAITAGAATPPDLGAASPTVLNKTIFVYNDEDTTVYVPSITYTYSVAPVTGVTATVTDATDNVVAVKDGIEGGIVMVDNTASFPVEGAETVAAKSAGTPVTDTFSVNYDASVFEEAGVYRYKLTETTADGALTDAGISRDGDYKSERYIDVYVTKVDGVLTVAGSVVFFENGNITTSTEKTDGFTDQTATTDTPGEFKPDTDPVVSVADKYFTYNYVVEKIVENSYTGAETFKFTIDVTGTAGQQFFYTDVNGTDATKNTGTVDATLTPELGNSDSVKLNGLPANVSVAVKEKNDNLGTYDVTLTGTGAANPTLSKNKIKQSEEAGFSAVKVSAYTGSESEAPTANLIHSTFTNKLVDISVTGVLFTVAPFVLMIGAAAFLAAVVIRSRKREASENII